MTTTRRTTLLAALLLLSVTAVWGSTFFLIKDLLERVPILDFLAIRFSIAAVLLLLVAPRALGRLSSDARKHALVLGALYGVAQILQTANPCRVSTASPAVARATAPQVIRVMREWRISAANSGVATTYIPVMKPDTLAAVCARPAVCRIWATP